jgi:hypothetical protein
MVGEEDVYYDWRNPGLAIAGLMVAVGFFSFGFTI